MGRTLMKKLMQFVSIYHYFKEKEMKRIIEIRAAEGGEDSKLFVKDLTQGYVRMAQRLG